MSNIISDVAEIYFFIETKRTSEIGILPERTTDFYKVSIGQNFCIAWLLQRNTISNLQ